MLEIVYRDEYCIVVNKPSGMLVHRSFMDKGETVFLLQELRDQIGCKVYPVHRLDKPTSGLILFVYDPEVLTEFQKLFSTGEIKKTYLAVVRGFLNGEGRIDYPLKREVDKYTQASSAVYQDAVTDYKTIRQTELPVPVGKYQTARYSFVELSPKTGRKHQLRRHMAHLRHPIVGDTRHGDGVHNRLYREHFNCHRLLLHASNLEFSHPFTSEMIRLYTDFGIDALLHTLKFSS